MRVPRDVGAWGGLRVVGVFPHPDDEAWAAGGLLARASAAGAEVQLIVASDGEAGVNRGGADGPLAEVRRAELQRAARGLGITNVHRLGWVDGAIAAAPVADLAARLAALAPDVVVGLGDDGGYGHTDHVALAAMLRAVVPSAVALWLSAFEPGLFEGVRAALAKRRPGLCCEGPLGSADADVVLDLSADERRRKLDAITAHRSQLPGGDPMRFLGPGIVATLLERERWLLR